MTPPPFRWGSIIAPALLPTFLFTLGEGAILPVLPALTARAGGDLAAAGLVASMVLLGQLLGDLPAGWIVARAGERRAMLGALGTACLSIVLAALATAVGVLALAMLLIGASAAVFALARHALLTTAVPSSHRARALSTLGGVYRLGLVLGPFLSAAVIAASGAVESVYIIAIVAFAGVALSLLVLPDPAGLLVRSTVTDVAAVSPLDVLRVIGRQRGVLARLGSAALFISAMRATRQVLLPLWGVAIGLSAAETAAVVGLGAAIDVSLFYVGGWLMDRFGRLATALPTTLGMGTAFLVLAATAEWEQPVAWFIGVTIALALSNGLGAGILMTMGSDLAGRENPAPFLGAWRLVLDAGGAVAPLVLTAVTAAASLATGAAVIGGLGFVGTGLLAWMIPRHLPRDRD